VRNPFEHYILNICFIIKIKTAGINIIVLYLFLYFTIVPQSIILLLTLETFQAVKLSQ